MLTRCVYNAYVVENYQNNWHTTFDWPTFVKQFSRISTSNSTGTNVSPGTLKLALTEVQCGAIACSVYNLWTTVIITDVMADASQHHYLSWWNLMPCTSDSQNDVLSSLAYHYPTNISRTTPLVITLYKVEANSTRSSANAKKTVRSFQKY